MSDSESGESDISESPEIEIPEPRLIYSPATPKDEENIDDVIEIKSEMVQVEIVETSPTEDFPEGAINLYDPNAFRNYNELPWYEKGILQYFHFPYEEMMQKQQDRMKKIIGQCKYCIGVKQISGSLNVTSNFIKHVRALHPQIYAVFEEERATRFKKPVKKRSSPHTPPLTQQSHVRKQESPLKHQMASTSGNIISYNEFSLTSSKIQIMDDEYESNQEFVEVTSQEQYNNHLLKFIVHGLQPVSIVDQSAFINFTHCLRPDLEPIDQVTVKRNLVIAKKNMLSSIISRLEKTHYVCTTLDLWVFEGNSFLGMTAHWLNEETMQRESAMFCCERFSNPHTLERVVELIRETHAVYGVEGKVIKIFTDNLTNDFKRRKLKKEETPPEVEKKGLTYQNADELLSVCQDQFILPENQLTAAQILKTIACKDAADAANWSPSYQLLYRESMAKCKSIWEYAQNNDKGTEMLKSTLGYSVDRIKNPWNFDFEFIRCLIQRESNLSIICQKFSIPQLTQRHISFLKEYVSVLHPLFQGIDVLMKEKNSTIGYLLPTLSIINKKISSLKVKNCATLQYTLVEALNKRFAEFSESKDYLLASITTPKFKVWWNDIGLQQEDMIELLKSSVAESLDNSLSNSDEDDDFFHNKSNWGGHSDPSFSYLNDQRTDLAMLEDFPHIKALYLRYNCALSTSVPVAKIFTNSILEQTVKGDALSDDLFETLLLLKLNKYEL